MNRPLPISPAVCGFVAALAVASAIAFLGVLWNELDYVADHPDAYGPAKVIAWAAGAGAALSTAIAILAGSLARASQGSQ